MNAGKIVHCVLFLGILFGCGAHSFSYGSGVSELMLKAFSINNLTQKTPHKQSCIETINKLNTHIEQKKYADALIELDTFKNNPCSQPHNNEALEFASAYLCLKADCNKEKQDKAVDYLENLAKNGDSTAQFALGNYFTDDLKEHYDFHRGVAFLSKAAASGDSDAQYILGLLYIDDESEHFDPKKAVAYFLQAYKQGDYEAAYELGLVYYEGIGVRKNFKKALKYFSFSGERGEGNGAAYAAALLYNSSKNEEDVKTSCYFATIAHLLGSTILAENPEIREKICPSLPPNMVMEVEATAKKLVGSLGDKS